MGLSDEAQTLLDDTIPVLPFVDRLAEAGLFVDALRVLAVWLSKRKAVWWAADCVEAACGERSQAQSGLIALARAWAREPSEEHRRAAMNAAETAESRLPACWVAQGAGWSGGSLAPPHLPAVPPDDHLTAQAVTSALLLAAVFVSPARAAENYRRFVDQGKQIALADMNWATDGAA